MTADPRDPQDQRAGPQDRPADPQARPADPQDRPADPQDQRADPPGPSEPPAAERLQVQRTIPADAAAIFRVLTDPQGHVAIDSSGMLMDATGDRVSAVGDRFVVHMDREALNDYPMGRYDVTVTIVTLVPGREIAWTVKGRIRPQIGHVYGYLLEPAGDDGTRVTSYYDWSSADPHWKQAGIFPVLPEAALRATLGILARTVARGYPAATPPPSAPAEARAAEAP